SAFGTRGAALAEAQDKHRETAAIHDEGDRTALFPGVRACKRPCPGRNLVEGITPPRERHRAEPAISRFGTADQPEREEEAAERDGDGEAEQLKIVAYPACLVIERLNHRGFASHDLS